ncbi:putative peroxisomal multifunctional enzyme [Colletotrichum sublineola]|uniref:Putative peroxisomal multifunctional enzyme n=1 Tax=Colletotrichum sublineola TaxID=1173701 RepID=A0A066Y1I8_COLSU|nr:putative peroxisomal multifunctional enzyme [Colletotrichum sublineola]
MILEAEQLLVDAKTNTAYTKMTSTAFGIGQGGYNGPRGPSKPVVQPPDRRPDAVHITKTTPEAALLYRLCGDYSPLHADEAFGQRAGFTGAILQGLGTWNMAAHGLLQKLGGSDPRRFKAYGARFKDVVYPGDTLETRMWVVQSEKGVDRVVFETAVKEDGRVVLMCLLDRKSKSAPGPEFALLIIHVQKSDSVASEPSYLCQEQIVYGEKMMFPFFGSESVISRQAIPHETVELGVALAGWPKEFLIVMS